MEHINLSINPTYYCNFRCSFCYLSDQQLGSSKRLDLKALTERLTEISCYRTIEHIDLYGGEVGLLPKTYLEDMLSTLKLFYKKPINVITNLSIVNPRFLEDDIDLSVSWDFSAREKYELVYSNMKSLTKPFHILILASDRLLNLSDGELNQFISKMNELPFLKTVEVKPYSLNPNKFQQANFKNFENFIIRWLKLRSSFSFEFINENKIKQCLSENYSSWSDDHLYLTPDGNWAVLEFDLSNREYFHELQGLNSYFDWADQEKKSVTTSPVCSKCDYLGHCLSEHLQKVESRDESCNGFYNLLKWYENAEL